MNVKMSKENIKLYQPSNATEGDWFISEWCFAIAHVMHH